MTAAHNDIDHASQESGTTFFGCRGARLRAKTDTGHCSSLARPASPRRAPTDGWPPDRFRVRKEVCDHSAPLGRPARLARRLSFWAPQRVLSRNAPGTS
ncbi:MAG: hypothetical protein QOG10_7172 [Kribbellaceae bacterium]|nr:hypothetical protein [Kribbellaceae bacterium]